LPPASVAEMVQWGWNMRAGVRPFLCLANF
jgi:hypothetical protein